MKLFRVAFLVVATTVIDTTASIFPNAGLDEQDAQDGPNEQDARRAARDWHRRSIERPFPLTNVRSIDGSKEQGGIGAANVQRKRCTYADYPDGDMKTEPEYPNARHISNSIHQQPEGEIIPNKRGLSDMIWAFGQIVDHDITLTDESEESGRADIVVPTNPDDILSGITIPFKRAILMPGATNKEHPNQITACIDASFVYGSDEERAKALRTGWEGTLKMSARGQLLPKNEKGFPNFGGTGKELFLAGDIRVNEQVGLTAMHTLFVREHNRLCKKIHKKYKWATDEQIYQLARKIVGAQVQMITYEEFLPAVLGPFAPDLEDYKYDKDEDPGICTEFAHVYRFGHTMLSPFLLLSDGKNAKGELALRDAFFNRALLESDPKSAVDHLIGGFITKHAQEIDRFVIQDVQTLLFQNTPVVTGHDLPALNIQRARDMGVPGYNDVRFHYGLDRVDGYSGISKDQAVIEAFIKAYDEGNINKVDLWTGAISEDHVEGASCGETVGTILKDQFTRLMKADPYFYKHDPDLTKKNLAGIINLEKFTFAQLIRDNTNLKGVKKKQNVFFVKEKKVKHSHSQEEIE